MGKVESFPAIIPQWNLSRLIVSTPGVVGNLESCYETICPLSCGDHIRDLKVGAEPQTWELIRESPKTWEPLAVAPAKPSEASGCLQNRLAKGVYTSEAAGSSGQWWGERECTRDVSTLDQDSGMKPSFLAMVFKALFHLASPCCFGFIYHNSSPPSLNLNSLPSCFHPSGHMLFPLFGIHFPTQLITGAPSPMSPLLWSPQWSFNPHGPWD